MTKNMSLFASIVANAITLLDIDALILVIKTQCSVPASQTWVATCDPPEVHVMYILHAAFTSQIIKGCQYLFVLLGSAGVKVACKTLVKLTPVEKHCFNHLQVLFSFKILPDLDK